MAWGLQSYHVILRNNLWGYINEHISPGGASHICFYFPWLKSSLLSKHIIIQLLMVTL